MVEQMDIKRQLRYKNSIYDVLKDIKLGNYNYLIIGKELDDKFIDIAFVEQKNEEGKIRYISPNSNVVFNKDITDFKRVQSQSLMNYIVNDIKDSINLGNLISIDDTLNYIDKIYQTIINSNDINTFFISESIYDNELQLEESIKTLISYYINEIKNYEDHNKLPAGEVLVPEEDVKDIYDKLEDTQNFGVSLIHDAITMENNPEDYMVDPTNNTFENKIEDKKSIFEPMPEFVEDNKIETNVSTNNLENDHLNDSVHNLSFQERLYLENEQKMNSRSNDLDLQDNLSSKTKALVLHNNYGRGNNAAYITISWLLYIIGSFELLIAIILMAKFI